MIRDAAVGIAAFLALGILTALISANVRVLAAQRGWDQHFSNLWQQIEQWPVIAMMLRMVPALRKKWWVWLFLGVSGGLASGLWLSPMDAKRTTPIGSPFGPTVYTEGGPIGWVLDSQFLVSSYGNSGDEINSVILQGKSRATVGFKEAYAVSNLTGHRQSFFIDVPYKGSYPVTKVDIPPQADVQLGLYWNPPLLVRDFLAEWGKFRVVITYDDGTTWGHEFDEAYVKGRLNRQIPSAFGPRVTLKDAK
jgi:hypothetical protein